MRILAFEPYYGGSHQSFIDGWIRHSEHIWDLHTLPARKWKWRMRHSALTFAAELEQRLAAGETWDLLFCSDMVNLAELRALAPRAIYELPAVIYFHENQLTYPVRFAKERDYQFGITNITSALAADAVWFNSGFHRDEFLAAIPRFLKKMPDHRPLEVAHGIRAKSSVRYPAIDLPPARVGAREPGPLRILWAARWEFDKAPEVLFEAVRILRARGIDFRLSVLGESFEEVPEVFAAAHAEFGASIDHWGYLEGRDDYYRALATTDVFVSTAIHEFFGLAAVEALAAGARPLLPARLAYPEVLELEAAPERAAYFYDGSAGELALALEALASAVADEWESWHSGLEPLRERARGLAWPTVAPEFDRALSQLAGSRRH